jgi:alcohol dehydrogenase
MTDISFKLDPEIIIGVDTINRAGTICAAQGGKAFVLTEQVLYEHKFIDRLVSIFEDANVETLVFDDIPAQATAAVAETAADLARGARCSIVVGFGGLKTQSTARLCAMLANSSVSAFDLLDGENPDKTFLPYLAIPTTGRDPFLFSDSFIAVDHRDRSVKLIKAPRGLCTATLIDGGLSESLSEKFASTTAFDGFCACVEGYCSTRAHALSDALFEHSISLYASIMDSYMENRIFDLVGGSTNAGLLMAMGCAISAPGIGTALAYALNGRFPVAKSWCSTALLPYVLERLTSARPEKMARVASLLGEPVEGASTADAAAMAVESIRRRMGLLKVPARLKEFDLSLDKLVTVAESARNLEFVSYSPKTISAEDAYDILKQAF